MRKLIGSLFAACVLASCSLGGNIFGSHHVGDGLLKLDGVVAVATTAEIDDHSLLPKAKKGYLILIDKDGGYNKREISSLRNQSISWELDSLFFADTQNDYWIQKDGTVVVNPSKKTDVGDGLVSLNDGKE